MSQEPKDKPTASSAEKKFVHRSTSLGFDRSISFLLAIDRTQNPSQIPLKHRDIGT